MNYTPENVKNILIAGHGGAGKTSLVEAMLFTTGAADRLGKIEAGTTVCDYDQEEIRRGVSLSSALAPVEYSGTKLNFIDAPGLFDFELGLYEGVMAAETVLITVSAHDGLQVGALKAYSLAAKHKKSHMFYISKMDTEHADFYKIFEDLKATFGPSVCPVVVPVGEGDDITYVNLIDMRCYKYDNGKPVEMPMPATGHRLDGLMAAISEAVAETNEDLFEKYFSGEHFTAEEMKMGVKEGVRTGAITPVICGAATKLAAVDLALEIIASLLPSAAGAPAPMATGPNGNMAELPCDPTGPLASYVFKTVADPFVGKLSFVKVFSGTLKDDSPLENSRTGEGERIGKLIFVRGKKQTDTKEIAAGDIGAITKLNNTKTGDMLCAPGKPYTVAGAEMPKPTYAMALTLKQKGDESKISTAMQRLIEEDGTLAYEMNGETMQQVLAGLGEQHLDVVLAKLKAKFGIEAELAPPRVAYRETIRKKVKAEGKHKKQTGGHGQYGHVVIEFEPTDAPGLVFEENVFGGTVPRNFFPAVEKGLQDAVKRGVIAGYPVVGLKATLLDGSYHPVDSSEMAFKTAAGIAYREGLKNATPVLLEPVGLLKAYVPENNTGDIMGEVNKRRGRVMGMEPDENGLQRVEAEVPMSEVQDFTTYMRSLTQGRGHYSITFQRYEPLPQNLEAKVVEEAAKFMGADKEE